MYLEAGSYTMVQAGLALTMYARLSQTHSNSPGSDIEYHNFRCEASQTGCFQNSFLYSFLINVSLQI